MSLSQYLVNKLSILKEEANILVKYVRNYYSSLKRLREFTFTSINIYLSMDGVIADIKTAESNCLRDNIDKIYPKKDIHSLKKFQMISALIDDIRNGTNYSPFSQSSIDKYLSNTEKSDTTSVEKIMNNFYSIFVDKNYIKNLKVLPSFKILANELMTLKKESNITFHIINSINFSQEVTQRVNWLHINNIPLDYDNNIHFFNLKKHIFKPKSYSILIDCDINNCLSFEDNGNYSILYSGNPRDCIDKLKAILKEHY